MSEDKPYNAGSIVKRVAVGRLVRVYYGRVGLGDYDWWCKA